METKNFNDNRRDFLKKTGIISLGIAGASFTACAGTQGKQGTTANQNRKQIFNMRGYAAPKLDVVRVGIVGLGNRGTGTVRRLANIEGLEIKALCDLEPDRVKRSADLISHLGHKPDFYSGNEEEWKKMCDRPDIDLVAVVTPWHLHTPMCVYAMEHNKHAYTELPAATSIEECWQLVETSEKTKKHCIQMSGAAREVNLNMVRKGFFGDLIHGEGCYIHDLLLGYNFTKHMYHNMWRLNANIDRNGNLYPQHGLVPLVQYMDINSGDRMDYLTSISSNDFLMGKTAEKLAAEDEYWQPYVGKNYRGNMNVTIIRTELGRTIVMQHDVTSPRPRGGNLLSGTKAIYQSGNGFALGHDGWLSEEEVNKLTEEYTPEVVKRFAEYNRQAEQVQRGGHSYYTTTLTDWRIVDCLRNGLPVDRDVYEAAVSSAITPLSIWSVSNRSNPTDVPDFTCGAWKTNKRGMDINLENGGGTTKLL
jgi:hypothetical protein